MSFTDDIQDDDSVFNEPQEEDAPDEKADDEQEEESEEESSEQSKDKTKDKPKGRKSAIAQKKYWRNQATKASTKVQELETQLAELKGAVHKPDDEKEAAAQKYIREQAVQVYKELQLEKSKEEAKELEAFEDKVQGILDDNPDIAEDELLDTIEEYEVEPQTALRILKKQGTKAPEKKPKMPKANRASVSDDNKAKPDDSNKSMWEILAEEKKKLSK